MKNKQALTLVALACLPGLALAHARSDGAAHVHDLSETLSGNGMFTGLLLLMALISGIAVVRRRQRQKAQARRTAGEGQP